MVCIRVKEKALFLVFVNANFSPPKIFRSMFDLSRTVWWEGRVCMCHFIISDYSPIPRDCYEFSLINDPESDATFFHYPSPTSSTEVSLDYDLIGWQQLLTDLVWLIYLKLAGNPCSLEYFTYSKCRWCILNFLLVYKKIFNFIDNSNILNWIILPTRALTSN